jgi:hypothetical protein
MTTLTAAAAVGVKTAVMTEGVALSAAATPAHEIATAAATGMVLGEEQEGGGETAVVSTTTRVGVVEVAIGEDARTAAAHGGEAENGQMTGVEAVMMDTITSEEEVCCATATEQSSGVTSAVEITISELATQIMVAHIAKRPAPSSTAVIITRATLLDRDPPAGQAVFSATARPRALVQDLAGAPGLDIDPTIPALNIVRAMAGAIRDRTRTRGPFTGSCPGSNPLPSLRLRVVQGRSGLRCSTSSR